MVLFTNESSGLLRVSGVFEGDHVVFGHVDAELSLIGFWCAVRTGSITKDNVGKDESSYSKDWQLTIFLGP